MKDNNKEKDNYIIIVNASEDELEHIEEMLNDWHILYRVE